MERDVAAEVDGAPGSQSPGAEHRLDGSCGRIALAVTARIDGDPLLEPRHPCVGVELDAAAGAPAGRAARASWTKLLEAAVVAEGDECRKDRGIELAVRGRAGAERALQEAADAFVDGHPFAGAGVQVRKVASRIESH